MNTSDDRPQDAEGEVLALLRSKINELHLGNGEPSTREIARRTSSAISHTTVAAVLKCTKLPRWGQVELVVEALQGRLEDFKRLWLSARVVQDSAAQASVVTLGPASSNFAAGSGADERQIRSQIESAHDSTGAFWKSLGLKSVFLVIGTHDRKATEAWERSGLVGIGCVKALVIIQRQLLTAGVNAEIVTVDELPAVRWSEDLVLIGGPDANRVTAEVLRQMDRSMSFTFPAWESHDVGLYDRSSSGWISPESDDRGDLVVDYGLIAFARNPLATNDAKVVVLAGCWGYGTAAAATLLGSKLLYENDVCRSGRPFEALVRTVVLQNTHHAASVVEARPLDAIATEKQARRSRGPDLRRGSRRPSWE